MTDFSVKKKSKQEMKPCSDISNSNERHLKGFFACIFFCLWLKSKLFYMNTIN